MGSGIYKRTRWHREITRRGVKRWYKENPNAGKRISNSVKSLWRNKEYRRKAMLILKSKRRWKTFKTREYRNRRRKIALMLWKRKDYRNGSLKTRRSNWANDDYKARMVRLLSGGLQNSQKKANHPERRVLLILKMLGVRAKFVGNSKLWIGSRNPDIRIFNSKKVIEVFGNYWHEGEHPNSRIKYYQNRGWDCLVLWEKKIKHSRASTIRKIKRFIRR